MRPTELLEILMLICFGISWPLSVIKNYKAKTAKSMSMPFILMILLGYVAGISAKILSAQINLVLAVYIINLLIVSANVPLYFINKQYDRRRALAHK